MTKKYDKKWWKTLAVKIFAIYPESDLNMVLSLCVLITQSLPHPSIPDHFSLLLHWSQTLPLCFPLLYATASPAFTHDLAVALGKEGACTNKNDSPTTILQKISQIYLEIFVDICSSMNKMSFFDWRLTLPC